MQTEKEYQQTTNERLNKMGFAEETKETLQMLLYWSYVEGGRDADQDTLKRVCELREAE